MQTRGRIQKVGPPNLDSSTPIEEVRKLECDRPLIPKQNEDPKSIFKLFGVYCMVLIIEGDLGPPLRPTDQRPDTLHRLPVHTHLYIYIYT